ncbi:MAG TPA: hypothetical protein VFG33_18650 [Kribbella sp.]|uniref:hypothetical protein n=1 Tax=Kribbella sp. TaxID=1871183 RepID=UPI002D77FE71|nr:hypothetical protein [Kribbella sp.]HET6295413.1 hypothetical protein [Kribbella sp.]
MAEPNEETCPACGDDLVREDAEGPRLVRWRPETGSNAPVQMFCNEACMAEWLLAQLTPQQLVSVLDPYLSRGSAPARQPFWYGRD